MTAPVLVLNGPNLNMLGVREPEIYGRTTLAEVESMCRAAARGPLTFLQSNLEGELVGWIQDAVRDGTGGIVINPAGYTFTSVALIDALKMFRGPVIELHISNVHARGGVYANSLVSPVATAVMAGFGVNGYVHALAALYDLMGGPAAGQGG